MDIAAWLRGLGLERYEAAFRDNEIDGDALPKLTAEDLKDLGVVLGGHRRKLLDAIAALRGPLPNPPPLAGEGRVGVEAERRQLTVMFCDLVGSTALSARLDPEDLREVIGAYHAAVAEEIGRFDGFVAKYMGDGVLAYFGYPQAHEDDAERAVRAGLAVAEATRRLQTSELLQVRIGLATGLAVVGDLIGSGAAQERTVVGETPNLAARLQTLAEPNTVVIAESTRRLVGSLFEYQSLGEVELKGLPAPVPAFRVIGESRVGSRFEALRSGETPLVGREEELDLLRRRWEQAKSGDGRVVLISAEPGIGKSRLAEAFRENIASEPHIRLRYFCSPHCQDSALFPFIGQLERTAGFERDDTSAARLDRLEALVAANMPAEGDVQLLAELLGVPFDDRYQALDLTPQRKKEKTFEALLHQIAALAKRQPVLMIFEDLHWADPCTRELLDLVVEQIECMRVLLIATFRPEFQAPWTDRPHVTTLPLRRLGREESDRLVRGLIGDAETLSRGVMDDIVERTDGVPLFLEELTKAVLENAAVGTIPATSSAVPATLHASLMARLDRLGPIAKELAQVGAVIGRDFSYRLLAAAAQRTEAELGDALGRLVDAGLVFQRGTPPEATFLFKHALVQDTAYNMLLRGPRQALHARIAHTLETNSPELLDTQPELLAQHYTAGGLVEKSIAYWGKAGNRSAALSAMAEAAAQFQQGLNQLALLPDDLEHQRQELQLRSSLAAVLLSVKGFAAPETGHAYARARVLWEQLCYPSEFVYIPYGQSLHHVYRGEFDLAQRVDEDLLRLNRQRSDPAGLFLGHVCAGRTLAFTGAFAASRSHLEEVLALYNSISGLSDTHIVSRIVVAQVMLEIVLFCLGFPDQAQAQSNAAIAEARRLAHPLSLTTSLSMASILHWLVGDNAALDELAEELVAVAAEQDFAQFRASGTLCRGWVKVKNGDVAEGISLLRSGSAAYTATGSVIWMPQNISQLACAYEIAGQIEEAVAQLDDALQIVEKTGERWLQAELHRHKGQLLLRQGHTETAEALYRKALSIAREQEAKLWELRAVMSLARLQRDQGRRAEARDLLAPVYGWFTEGFDTPDLKDAKALLDQLA